MKYFFISFVLLYLHTPYTYTHVMTTSAPPPLYSVLSADEFDAASREWRRNKVVLPNGAFKYKCKLCDELVYVYTTQHRHFHLFADDFDKMHVDHPNCHDYCEVHLHTPYNNCNCLEPQLTRAR